ARELAEKGDAAFGSGRCDKAITLWKKAEATFHAPTLILRIARCQALVGRVVDATASLQRVVDDTLGPEAPDAWRQAKKEARRELPDVRARIARVSVTAVGAQVDANADVDGNPVTLATPIEIDPGPHRVRVQAGAATWERSITLEDGQSQS